MTRDLAWASVTPRKHVHEWGSFVSTQESIYPGIPATYEACACGLTRADFEARQRLGRNNKKRGKHYEHGWAARLGMRQTGGLNKEDDALNDLFVGQAKSMASARFPGWMSLELDKLRARWADRIPILGILEAAGQGRKGRRLIVVDEADWIALHVGTEVEKVVGWIK